MLLTRFNLLYIVILIYKFCNVFKFFLFILKIELRSIEISIINFNFNWLLLIKDRISIYYYIIKFQKRELSHIYIFIILYFKNRYLNVNEINVIINVEIFDYIRFFNLYIIVIKYIIYDNYNYYVINKTNIVLFYWNSNKD